MDLWKSLSGMLKVEITGAEPEKVIDSITLAKIPIFHIQKKSELTYQITIRRRDARHINAISRRLGARILIIQKQGLYWKLYLFFHRPVLLILIFLLFSASVYLPTRTLFISVRGNTNLSDHEILSAAENCGIYFGACRTSVRSEQMKNSLMAALPQLQWAGVNTSGCTAVISVQENMHNNTRPESYQVSNLVAERDGFILAVTITSGTAQVFPGNAVTEGELLVSGYTDCGICLQATSAEGEILAQTNRKADAVTPAKYYHIETIQKRPSGVSLLLGKKRINLWKDSRIFTTSCGRMYQEYFVSLPGGFRLPVALCIDQHLFYDVQQVSEDKDNIRFQLQQFSENYLLRQMIAGRILSRQNQLSFANGTYKLESTYTCTEMIGKAQREQIGVFNGKGN